MDPRPRITRVLALALLLPRGALAQEAAPPGAPAYELGEIVVSTGRREGVEAAQAVTELRAEDLERRGAATLDQALAALPGLNVRTGNEGVPRIDVRGFRTRHLVLLLDGVPINSAFDQQFDPTLVPTDGVARVTLTRGTSSVLYGQGGLGGVLDVVTRRGEPGWRGALSLGAGTGEPFTVRGHASGAYGPVDFLAAASTARVDGAPLPGGFEPTAVEGGRRRENSDRERTSLLANVGLRASPVVTLGFTTSYATGAYGKPTLALADPSLDPFAPSPRFGRVEGFENLTAQLAGALRPAGPLGLRGWVFVSRLEEHGVRYDDATFSTVALTGSLDERRRSTIAGASLQPRLELERLVLTGLVSAERDAWTSTGFEIVAVGEATPIDEDHATSLLSAALEAEVTPAERVLVSAGAGVHRQLRAGRAEDAATAQLSSRWDPVDGTRLRASLGRNVRFPSVGDLYASDQGNPALRAERATTIEAGVEQVLPLGATARLDAFATRAEHLIQNDQALQQNVNLAEVRYLGFEAGLSARPLPAVTLRASYGFLRSEDRSRPGRTAQQYTPRDRVTVEGAVALPWALSASASALWVANQVFYTRNAVSPPARARLADYAVVNVRLQRAFGPNLVASLGADNLLDRSYETSYGFPQPGRRVYGGIELRR